jgi:probable rRNA maturation factor
MNFVINIYNTTDYRRLPKSRLIKTVESALKGENIKQAEIRIIFVDDREIHDLNTKFLGHDYPTDVITFPFDEENLEGEIYISVDTAQRQAADYGVTLGNELRRLAVHGALHLAGYDDDTDEKRAKMNDLETKYINETDLG